MFQFDIILSLTFPYSACGSDFQFPWFALKERREWCKINQSNPIKINTCILYNRFSITMELFNAHILPSSETHSRSHFFYLREGKRSKTDSGFPTMLFCRWSLYTKVNVKKENKSQRKLHSKLKSSTLKSRVNSYKVRTRSLYCISLSEVHNSWVELTFHFRGRWRSDECEKRIWKMSVGLSLNECVNV